MSTSTDIRSAPPGARFALHSSTRGQALAAAANAPASPAAPAATRPAPRKAPATAAGQAVTTPGAEPLWDGPEPAAGTHEHAAIISGLCAEAGFPEMTGFALKHAWNTATLKTKIAKANAIKSVAQAVNLPAMAAPLIRVDMTLQDAREALFTAKANSDAAIRTDTTPPSERTRAAAADKPVDAKAIYERMNAPSTKPRSSPPAAPVRPYGLASARR